MVHMDSQVKSLVIVKSPALTPKAILNQKFASNAIYKTEELQNSSENICPGLAIPQKGPCLYRCHLQLPDFSLISEAFPRKKDAEQSAAKMAIEKLGIQSSTCESTLQDPWTELVARVSWLFTEKFLSSSHPLIGHFREALERNGEFHGFIPLSVIGACDLKIVNWCKSIHPGAESDPLIMLSLITKAARLHPICIPDDELWIRNKKTYSQKTIQTLANQYPRSAESVQLEAVLIPFMDEKPIEILTLNISPNHYYLDEIGSKLNLKDSSRVLISRPIGKVTSDMRLYFPAPEISSFSLDSSLEMQLNANECELLKQTLNKRASYLSVQNIYGDAILAVVGYTRRSSGFLYKHVSLSTYYRILVGKIPVGNYKLSREAMLVVDLPTNYATRSNWRGSSPRDLLSMFCHHHRISVPIFDIEIVNTSDIYLEKSKRLKQSCLPNLEDGFGCEKEFNSITNNDPDSLVYFRCVIKIFSSKNDLIVQYSQKDIYQKQTDAIQNASFIVISWLNAYFKQLDMSMSTLFANGQSCGIHVNTEIFLKEFGLCLPVHGASSIYDKQCSSVGSSTCNQPKQVQENETISFEINGPDSGISPSEGSLVCISYTVVLMSREKDLNQILETKDEFEFEIGTGAVIHQLDACIVQMSMNQTANFMIKIPSRDLILAVAFESAGSISQSSLCDYFLQYSVKLLRITYPFEKMLEAHFKPSLSKQRVEFAVRFINKSYAKTLVDFGCGSGSLLVSLLEHKTTLEMIFGVDISRRGLVHAAKILHSKLSSSPISVEGTTIKSVVLYDGSITVFDPRLYGSDIGTCIEVIEHMQEDQATLFGDMVLSMFCPRLLIVSTPNYEYNPILQKSSISNKEVDPEDKSQAAPCKFRNYDHKFEWTRKQFEHWANSIASKHNYSVEFSGVGGSGAIEPGFASQIAVFRQQSAPLEEKVLEGNEVGNPYEVIWEWNNVATKS